jgi:hypothetical protein
VEVIRMARKRSVQELMGVRRFTKYGLFTDRGELIFYQVNPTNISVLSKANIETKITHLKMLLSSIPDIEITCTDSSECFDDNKVYLQERIAEESNPFIRGIIQKDVEFLDGIQVEMATARQFVFIARLKNLRPEQVFTVVNRIEKVISEQGFESRRFKKEDIKRFLALYFESSFNGELMPDVDGAQYFNLDYEEEE